MKLRFSLFIAFITLTSSHPALAQWVNHGAPVCTALDDQFGAAIIPDGAGGAFLTWYDSRNVGGSDIYAQRINALGAPLWAADGVAACTAPNSQFSPQLVSDGAGGLIVTWNDFRGGATMDIYAQRLNASGVTQWTANGVALSTAADDQSYPTIVTDGAGGAIVTWMDERTAGIRDIYCRRINASGTPLWTANGVALCTAAGAQQSPMIVSDGVGGAVVTWYDFRGGINYDIYCQRVNGSGTVLWAANGVGLCTAANDQYSPTIVSDNASGAIVAWYDERNGVDYDIYTQRISASGIVQWTANGVAACDATNDQQTAELIADGAGGAIITWSDFRSTNFDIYAQRITSAGSLQWANDGVALCTATNNQLAPTIQSDGAGGAIVAWADLRNTSTDIYAQRVDISGLVQWSSNGVAVCTAAQSQHQPVITSDGAGGAIIAWDDGRNVPDIYAQRVEATYGYWGRPEPTLVSVADIPNDQGGHVAINWKASGRDEPVPRTISYYTIWRAVDPVLVSKSAESALTLTKLSDLRADAVPPIHISTPSTSPPPYYWELAGTQMAHGWPGYSFSAPTRADNTPQFFMVAAHIEFDDYVAFTSNAISGQSVDNLAPSSPLMLTAQRVGNYVYLHWTGVHVPDLRDYSVYRKSSSGVTPVPINFLTSSEDTVMADTNPPASALYYIVTAVDVHQNQSGPSNEASVGATTDAGNLPPVTALTVLQNHPNPFTERTELSVGLPSKADINVELFDVAGRRVREISLEQRAAGWQRVQFDGRDDRGRPLPSGVYFYRVHAAGESATHKMVIAR